MTPTISCEDFSRLGLEKCGMVILSYQSREPLHKCIAAALAQDYQNTEVIVVDNGSNDGTDIMVENDFGQVIFMRRPKNGGTASINLGIERALDDGCEFVLLVDSDAILDVDAASLLITFLRENPSVGVAGPSGYELNRGEAAPVVRVDRRTLLLRTERYVQAPAETDCIGMAMIRKSVFVKVGMIEKSYFAYYQDTDFSLRARRAGFRIFIVPEAKFHHLGAYTTARVVGLRGLISVRNRFILLKMNSPPPDYPQFILRAPAELLKVVGQWLLARQPREIIATLVGTASGIIFLVRGSEPGIIRRIETSLLGYRISLD